MTILAAIGEIGRFPTANQLVGYAGLGTKVKDSGDTHWSGRITKMGWRDLRRAMVEAAQAAVRCHDHWRTEYKRLRQQTAKKKAKVAIARKLLIAVWHTLTNNEVDRFATPHQVACSFFALAYKLRVKNLPDGMSALQFTRHHLDKLEIGQELTQIRWGSKTYKLPPSQLPKAG